VSLMRPHKKYSYVRAADGQGGFTKTVTYIGVLYGSLETFANAPAMIVKRQSEVVPEDIVGVTENYIEAFYEVMSVMIMGSAGHKRLMLSRLERPIRPVVQGELS
jgi:hypothetical protein